MGLDLSLGLAGYKDQYYDEDDYYQQPLLINLIRHLCEKHGLKLPAELREDARSKKADTEEASGRAYFLKILGDYCRKNQLDYPHMSRITCSQWQTIIPIQFPEQYWMKLVIHFSKASGRTRFWSFISLSLFRVNRMKLKDHH